MCTLVQRAISPQPTWFVFLYQKPHVKEILSQGYSKMQSLNAVEYFCWKTFLYLVTEIVTWQKNAYDFPKQYIDTHMQSFLQQWLYHLGKHNMVGHWGMLLGKLWPIRYIVHKTKQNLNVYIYTFKFCFVLLWLCYSSTCNQFTHTL